MIIVSKTKLNTPCVTLPEGRDKQIMPLLEGMLMVSGYHELMYNNTQEGGGMDYEQFEAQVEEIEKSNRKHLATFETWLKAKGLTDKTINNHINNVDFYINFYLNYYEPQDIRYGCYSIGGFLGSFFIRKALWSSCAQIKSNAASIKKFYACMLENGVVEKDDYANLCQDIKEDMDEWLEAMLTYGEA